VAEEAPREYPRPPLRRRLLVLLLAVATALAIVWLLLARPGDPKHEALRAARERSAQAASAARSDAPGVGGKAEVMLLPSAPSAPR
jgi:type II secretory pathway component PulM